MVVREAAKRYSGRPLIYTRYARRVWKGAPQVAAVFGFTLRVTPTKRFFKKGRLGIDHV